MINLINEALSGGPEQREYHRILYNSVLATNAQVIIDLGTFYGSSAEALARAADKTGGKVYTIDICGEDDFRGDAFYVRKAKEKLQGRANVEFIKGDSIVVAENWDKGDVDIVFCDTDHCYERVVGELRAWGKHNPKVFLIHDIWDAGPVQGPPYRAMKDYAEEKGKQFFSIGDDQGLGVVIMR